jgi:hypothetical protein
LGNYGEQVQMKTLPSFSDDVVIDGKTLKSTLFTIPSIQSWEVILYSN